MFTNSWFLFADALYDAYRFSKMLGIYISVQRITLITDHGIECAWKLVPIW